MHAQSSNGQKTVVNNSAYYPSSFTTAFQHVIRYFMLYGYVGVGY